MAKVIKLDQFEEICSKYEIYQSALNNQLIIKVGETERGDDRYKPLIEFLDVYDIEIKL